jgi:hypothetical protein
LRVLYVGQTERHQVTEGGDGIRAQNPRRKLRKIATPLVVDSEYDATLLTSGDGDHSEVRALEDRVFRFIPRLFFDCDELDCIALLCGMGDDMGLVGRLLLAVLFQGSITVLLFSEVRPLVAAVYSEVKPISTGVLGREAEPGLGLDFC